MNLAALFKETFLSFRETIGTFQDALTTLVPQEPSSLNYTFEAVGQSVDDYQDGAGVQKHPTYFGSGAVSGLWTVERYVPPSSYEPPRSMTEFGELGTLLSDAAPLMLDGLLMAGGVMTGNVAVAGAGFGLLASACSGNPSHQTPIRWHNPTRPTITVYSEYGRLLSGVAR